MAELVPDLVKGELSGEITINNIKSGESRLQRNLVGMVLQDSDTYLFEDVDQKSLILLSIPGFPEQNFINVFLKLRRHWV